MQGAVEPRSESLPGPDSVSWFVGDAPVQMPLPIASKNERKTGKKQDTPPDAQNGNPGHDRTLTLKPPISVPLSTIKTEPNDPALSIG